jgi:competence protein ComEC
MPTIIHFINVGQGNMVLIEADNGDNFVFDCNITEENEDDVLGYVAGVLGYGTNLDAFICSHRDADHMRGIEKLHQDFPIQKIWDSGYPGTTTNSGEYLDYMNLRRTVGHRIIKKKKFEEFGKTRFRYFSAKDDRLPKDANAQGVVIKVEQRDESKCLASAMLTGDSDAETWRYGIMKDYSNKDLKSSILMAGHHGSDTFFDDPNDKKNYFEAHMQAIDPYMTIVSVGKNSHGHPDKKALEFYEEYSKGSPNKGNKVFRTDNKGTMRLTLKDKGGWSLKTDL